jgi:hypothetical protein
MSKIKDHLLLQEDVKLEQYTKFMDWIYDTFKPEVLSERDIEQMAEQHSTINSRTNKIISTSALNNTNYNPVVYYS